MYFVTGDTHGDLRKVARFCAKRKLTKDDVVIILGDAGINYFGNHRDKDPRKQASRTAATIFCIHGNHEQRPQSMDMYREKRWHGGIVYVEDKYPNILFAKDGEIFDFDGYKTLVIGGAYSVDKFYRLENGWSWFEDEQPDEKTKQYVEAQLDSHDWRIDIVLSHTCPKKYEPIEAFIEGLDQSLVDKSTEEWLDYVEEKLDYKRWYCGHFHISKRIDKLQFMFEDFDVLRVSGSDNLQLRSSSYSDNPQVFFISDLHFGHANIIRFCDRPFDSVEEMDRVLIDNWNARVRIDDHVYIVGDFAYRNAQPVTQYLEKLKGHKHLILGNHDQSWTKNVEMDRYFESISKMDDIKDGGRRIVLCHYPLMTWPGRESFMVYGHIHANKDGEYWPQLQRMNRALNASVEINGYQPVILDELIENNSRFREEK